MRRVVHVLKDLQVILKLNVTDFRKLVGKTVIVTLDFHVNQVYALQLVVVTKRVH